MNEISALIKEIPQSSLPLSAGCRYREKSGTRGRPSPDHAGT